MDFFLVNLLMDDCIFVLEGLFFSIVFGFEEEVEWGLVIINILVLVGGECCVYKIW